MSGSDYWSPAHFAAAVAALLAWWLIRQPVERLMRHPRMTPVNRLLASRGLDGWWGLTLLIGLVLSVAGTVSRDWLVIACGVAVTALALLRGS